MRQRLILLGGNVSVFPTFPPMTSKISFIDFAKMVLSDAQEPMSVSQIWAEGCRLGLDKQLKSFGKTPVATLGARLYVLSKNPQSGVVAVGANPKRFACGPSASNSHPVMNNPGRIKRNKERTYSFTDCAQKVLETFGGGKPMHYRDITNAALRQGWLKSSGQTPEATMYAQILTEIRRKQRQGNFSRFVQLGRGLVDLNRGIENDRGLRAQVEKHNASILEKLHKVLMSMSPVRFEELIGELLVAMGFEEMEVTRSSGDGGIDVRGTWVITDGVSIKMAVQVKRWKNNVQSPVVQGVRGSLATDERGLIITTSDFSKGARSEAEDPKRSSPISLINGKQLVRLFVENSIFVSREHIDLLSLSGAGTELAP